MTTVNLEGMCKRWFEAKRGLTKSNSYCYFQCNGRNDSCPYDDELKEPEFPGAESSGKPYRTEHLVLV